MFAGILKQNGEKRLESVRHEYGTIILPERLVGVDLARVPDHDHGAVAWQFELPVNFSTNIHPTLSHSSPSWHAPLQQFPSLAFRNHHLRVVFHSSVQAPFQSAKTPGFACMPGLLAFELFIYVKLAVSAVEESQNCCISRSLMFISLGGDYSARSFSFPINSIFSGFLFRIRGGSFLL